MLKTGTTLLLSVLSINLIAAENITFKDACRDGNTIQIAAVGDVLLHSPLQKKAAIEKDFGYLWQDLGNYIADADVAYANLEGPTAINTPVKGPELKNPGECWDSQCYSSEFRNATKYTDSNGNTRRRWNNGSYYSSYPLFNYHPDLGTDLYKSGFDVVSTANNHSLDRRQLGADRTIEALEKTGLQFTGTRLTTETETDRSWITRTRNNGITLSWISCTYGTNGMPDKKDQVLHCFSEYGKKKIPQLIKQEVKLGNTVIVTPHWGVEYSSKRSDSRNLTPTTRQTKYGKKWLEDGASLILGNHPHAFQKIEKHTTSDKREGLIVYSMGNFVSNQGAYGQRATGVVFVGMTRDYFGKVSINGVKLMPAYMGNRYSRGEQMSIIPLQKSSTTREMKYLKGVIGPDNFVYHGEVVKTNSQCKS